MPKVPELNLPKFEQLKYPSPPTKQEKINSRYWRYKKGVTPESDPTAGQVHIVKRKKIKAVTKTTGLTWVEHSLIAFNGSGYADRSEATNFVNSYISYNKWKKRDNAVKLANQYYHALLPLAETLLPSVIERQPSKKNWSKYQQFINSNHLV